MILAFIVVLATVANVEVLANSMRTVSSKVNSSSVTNLGKAPNFRTLTALLITKHKQRILDAPGSPNTTLAYLRVAENLELLQLFTPFPLLMFVKDPVLFATLARISTQRNLEFLVNTYMSWKGLYDPSVNINVNSCDMAFLRPTCVINTAYFPPVLCETTCPHTCGGDGLQVNLPAELIVLQRRRSSVSEDKAWELAKRSLIPPTYNTCPCGQRRR